MYAQVRVQYLPRDSCSHGYSAQHKKKPVQFLNNMLVLFLGVVYCSTRCISQACEVFIVSLLLASEVGKKQVLCLIGFVALHDHQQFHG